MADSQQWAITGSLNTQRSEPSRFKYEPEYSIWGDATLGITTHRVLLDSLTFCPIFDWKVTLYGTGDNADFSAGYEYATATVVSISDTRGLLNQLFGPQRQLTKSLVVRAPYYARIRVYGREHVSGERRLTIGQDISEAQAIAFIEAVAAARDRHQLACHAFNASEARLAASDSVENIASAQATFKALPKLK